MRIKPVERQHRAPGQLGVVGADDSGAHGKHGANEAAIRRDLANRRQQSQSPKNGL